jgi:hypothetical protein
MHPFILESFVADILRERRAGAKRRRARNIMKV